jgi:hypothetical protein
MGWPFPLQMSRSAGSSRLKGRQLWGDDRSFFGLGIREWLKYIKDLQAEVPKVFGRILLGGLRR